MIASAKVAWGVAGIMAVALAVGGYQYASRSGNLPEQVARFAKERNALQSRLAAIEKEAGTLKTRIAEFDRIRGEADAAEKKAAESEERLKEAESRLEEVEERLRTRESELGRSRSEAAAQEKRDRGELDRLQTSLRDADRFLVEFRDALAASSQRIEELQTQNVSATERLKEAESRLEEVEERLRTRESELVRSRSEAAAQEKRDRGELDRLQTSLRDADRFLVEFRDALAASSQRIEELQTQNVSATEAVVSLRAENRKLREELKHFTREVQELSAVSQEAQSTRRSLQERIARLRERFEEAVRATEAVVSLRAENRKLREELKHFTREVQELSAVSQEAQSTRQSLQERIARLRERFEEAVRDKEREIEQLRASHKFLQERLQSEIKKKDVAVRQEKEHISIEIVNRVTFETGRAELTESSKNILEVIYASLAPVKDGLIVIEGHADNRPIHGSLVEKFKSNWELSLARAAAVVRYLEGKGMDSKRMSVAGYSSFRPLDTNLTPVGRSRNRRVEILLVPGAGPATMKR